MLVTASHCQCAHAGDMLWLVELMPHTSRELAQARIKVQLYACVSQPYLSMQRPTSGGQQVFQPAKAGVLLQRRDNCTTHTVPAANTAGKQHAGGMHGCSAMMQREMACSTDNTGGYMGHGAPASCTQHTKISVKGCFSPSLGNQE